MNIQERAFTNCLDKFKNRDTLMVVFAVVPEPGGPGPIRTREGRLSPPITNYYPPPNVFHPPASLDCWTVGGHGY